MKLKMYGFFRSGTSHRTRIILNLKQIEYESIAISLAKNEQHSIEFKNINPQGFVPVVLVNQQRLTQSPAIIEWLEAVYPEPALLPKDEWAKAQVRAIAALIACDIHPINNKRILEYLRHSAQFSPAQIDHWCRHWIEEGFNSLEYILAQDQQRGLYCFGQQLSLADAYLIPQVDSAKRFQVDMSKYPNIQQIYQHCMGLAAFQQAAPDQQNDAI